MACEIVGYGERTGITFELLDQTVIIFTRNSIECSTSDTYPYSINIFLGQDCVFGGSSYRLPRSNLIQGINKMCGTSLIEHDVITSRHPNYNQKEFFKVFNCESDEHDCGNNFLFDPSIAENLIYAIIQKVRTVDIPNICQQKTDAVDVIKNIRQSNRYFDRFFPDRTHVMFIDEPIQII